MATNVNFYKGSGLPASPVEEGSFVLNEDNKTLWYSDGETAYPIDKPGVKVINYEATVTAVDVLQPDVDGYYVYECAVPNMTADADPIADLYIEPGTNAESSRALLSEWNKVCKIETLPNKIVVYTSALVLTSFKIMLKTIGI